MNRGRPREQGPCRIGASTPPPCRHVLSSIFSFSPIIKVDRTDMMAVQDTLTDANVNNQKRAHFGPIPVPRYTTISGKSGENERKNAMRGILTGTENPCVRSSILRAGTIQIRDLRSDPWVPVCVCGPAIRPMWSARGLLLSLEVIPILSESRSSEASGPARHLPEGLDARCPSR
jgi:hypothetical protein